MFETEGPQASPNQHRRYDNVLKKKNCTRCNQNSLSNEIFLWLYYISSTSEWNRVLNAYMWRSHCISDLRSSYYTSFYHTYSSCTFSCFMFKEYDACWNFARNNGSTILLVITIVPCHQFFRKYDFEIRMDSWPRSTLSFLILVAVERERLQPRQRNGFIPFQLLLAATNHFHESNIVGEGGFGKVYKGINTDGVVWAVKRSKYVSREVKMEFEVEVSNFLFHLRVTNSRSSNCYGREYNFYC